MNASARTTAVLALTAAVALGAGACGSSKSSSSKASASASGPGALSAEAKSAATGDIPDNQMFLTFTNASGGYTIRYPEGWTQRGSAGDVTFQDKNNLVHIVVSAGPPPTPASVRAQLSALARTNPTLAFQPPRTLRIGALAGVAATYTTRSAPNSVTGKRVTLVVDRYELASGTRRAVVDLGTPRGVDNVDAYRMMIQSFRFTGHK